jgi:hypothetical protein
VQFLILIYSGSQESKVLFQCPARANALRGPMPCAGQYPARANTLRGPRTPHVTEKGYMLIVARTPSAVKNSKIYCTFPDLLSNCDLDHPHS